MSVLAMCVSMYGVVIFSIFAIAASAAEADLETCKRSLHPGVMRCCKKDPPSKFMMMNDGQECFKLSRDPISCASEMCMAKKRGLMTSDDKLDKVKFEESITKDFQGEPELVEAIKKNCINGDLELFGAPDFCELIKMKHCVMTQAMMLCPEWSDENNCKGTKELVQECTKLFS